MTQSATTADTNAPWRSALTREDVSAAWVFPVVLKKVIAFQKTLAKEPPIRLGTPDPYSPPR